MKKSFYICLLMFCSFLLQGSGYKGTLPDLNNRKDVPAVNQEKKAPQNDILPLDKLTLPVKQVSKVDKVQVKYQESMLDAIGQLERIKEVLDGDRSFKNFVAAANVLNLTTENIREEFKNEARFAKTIGKLSDINDDTQTMKDYWIKINKNAPYVSYYVTRGAYSGAVLNEQLNNFSNVLEYAIRDLKQEFNIK